MEERLVCGAQIVQPILTIGCFDETIFGALAVTGKAYFAFPAVTGQCSFLVLTKLDLLRGGEQLDQMSFATVAQLVFGLYKMVAGIEIAVMFQSYRLAACFRKYADRTRSPNSVGQG
jgi:hypothetical protein